MVELFEALMKSALNRLFRELKAIGWCRGPCAGGRDGASGRCGEMQRGFSVILVPSTGPSPQEGPWQRGMSAGVAGVGWPLSPQERGLSSLPAGHTEGVGAELPIVSISAFSTING